MTDHWMQFNPVFESLWLAIVLVATSIIVFAIELKKPSRYLLLRLTLLLFGILGLGALLFRPEIRTEKTDTVILLTENFDRKKTDSLLDLNKNATVYSLPGVELYHGSKVLTSIHNLDDLKNIDFVIGDGLSTSALDVISDKNFNFISSDYPQGVIDLQLPATAIVNKRQTVFGKVNFKNNNQKIVLVGPGGKEDSVLIDGNGIESFAVHFTPKQTGNFLYSLNVAGDSNKLPIQVVGQTPSKILFLQQYPTFETRYLKQMLGEKHDLLFRYELSKNIFRFEKINNPGSEFQRITEDVLRNFDVLILDTDAFQQLSSNETRSIKNSIKNGLGVIILFNEYPTRSVQSFLPFEISKNQSDTAHFQLSGKKLILPSWPMETKSVVNPSIRNKNRILSGYSNDGFGKVGFQFLQETYRLALEGDSLSYVTLWSDLLEKVARKKQEPFQIRVNKNFPRYADEPVEIEVITNEESPKLFFDSVAVPLKEDVFIDGLWRTKVWADQAGWKSIQVDGATSSATYISPNTDWRSLASANTIQHNKIISTAEATESRNVVTTFVPINPLLFLILTLLCFGGLWLLPKV